MSCKVIVPKTAVINKTCEVFDCKVIETRPQAEGRNQDFAKGGEA